MCTSIWARRSRSCLEFRCWRLSDDADLVKRALIRLLTGKSGFVVWILGGHEATQSFHLSDGILQAMILLGQQALRLMTIEANKQTLTLGSFIKTIRKIIEMASMFKQQPSLLPVEQILNLMSDDQSKMPLVHKIMILLDKYFPFNNVRSYLDLCCDSVFLNYLSQFKYTQRI